MTTQFQTDMWDIILDPETGSLFRKCRYKNFEVLRDFNSDGNANSFPQLSASHFPLLPFSNRIKDGTFDFEERTVKVSRNAPGQPHPLHGYGWVSPWKIRSQSKDSITLLHNYEPGDWPWPYEGQQTISVTDNILRLELALTNRGTTLMPAGIGFHPYYPDLETATLTFSSGAVWMADNDVLPTEKIALSQPFDLSMPRPLKSVNLDHCYEDVGTAKISWSNSPLNLTIKSSDNLSRAAVYTAHSDNCFCFEPISHTHNAINMDDPEAEGLVFLRPGETVSGWCEIHVELK